MIDRSGRAAWLSPLALLLVLAAASLVPDLGWFRLSSSDDRAARGVEAAFDALPDRPNVLVGFDPDLGTYAEIRPTVRAMLADLLQREASLAFVSLTPEGRALLDAELDRLAREGANPRRLVDLGFVPGAEAALVRLSRGALPAGDDGAVARRLNDEGVAAIAAAVVVGGNDLGPRSWVEQFLPRAPMPLVAVTPTVLLPEIQPYLVGGQVDGLLGTPRDGAAYRAGLRLENLERLADEHGPSSFAVLVGLLLALGVLVHGLARRVNGGLRDARSREAA
jgi:hypothetical protein